MPRILLVDDDPDTLETCKMGLLLPGNSSVPADTFETSKPHDFQVDAFTNPELALEKFKQVFPAYDLVITDVRMPLLSGFELAKKIREVAPDVPILFMTGFEISPAEYRESNSVISSSTVIDKPFRISSLTASVSRLVKTRATTS